MFSVLRRTVQCCLRSFSVFGAPVVCCRETFHRGVSLSLFFFLFVKQSPFLCIVEECNVPPPVWREVKRGRQFLYFYVAASACSRLCSSLIAFPDCWYAACCTCLFA